MDISERIKYLRKQRGLTLEAVGEHVGVGKSTVRKWESGDIKNMRRDKIALLAEALGVTPGYLMGWESDEKESVQDKLQKIKDEVFMAPAKSGKWVMLTKWFGDMNMNEFDMWYNAIAANHNDEGKE